MFLSANIYYLRRPRCRVSVRVLLGFSLVGFYTYCPSADLCPRFADRTKDLEARYYAGYQGWATILKPAKFSGGSHQSAFWAITRFPRRISVTPVVATSDLNSERPSMELVYLGMPPCLLSRESGMSLSVCTRIRCGLSGTITSRVTGYGRVWEFSLPLEESEALKFRGQNRLA